jgi:cytosine/adenosine deaminase-related metal-dependent hydrolase
VTGVFSSHAITNVTAFLGDDLKAEVVDILIDRGRITGVEPAGAGRGSAEANRIDGTGLLAFPGMVDGHDHLRNLTPGLPLGEGLTLDDFLRVMWATQAEMGVTEYRVAALLGMTQRLEAGVTTVCDHCYTFHHPGLDEASIDGYEESGGRWAYARGIMTRPYDPVVETWDEAAAKIRVLADGRVPPARLFVAPVSIRQASAEDFRKGRALADELGCGLYTHVAETAAERDAWHRECGSGPIAALDNAGFLTDRTVLVHCVDVQADEIELMAARGCHVIHCPTNNMKLAKGFTPVPELLAAGVNVGMGIDMMADMFTEMRAEVGMHAVHRGDPNAITKQAAMRMATRGGAAALGLADVTGAIAPGRAADLVLIDGRSLTQAVMVDPAYALLYATDPGMIRYVLVDGNIVVEDGKSTIVDEQALLEEAEEIAAHYLERIGVAERPWYRRA